MADQEVKFSNFYESTLAAGSGGLPTNVTVATLTAAPTSNGTSAIGTPYYLVIDPDSASKREVVEVTAATGTSLTAITRDKEGRYGAAGDAATAPNHAEGTVVRMAVVKEMFEDVHDRVDADETTNAAHRSNTSNPHSVTAAQVSAIPSSDLQDDDTFATAAADKVASSESIKAYADTKLPLAGGTLSGNVAFGDNEASSVVLKDYAETDVAVTSTAGVVAIDLANGNTGSLTLTENVTDIDFTNVPANGVSTFTLKITQDAASAYTVAINAITVNGGGNVTAKTAGAGGFTMTATLSAEDLLFFMFFDAGTPYLTAQQEMS